MLELIGITLDKSLYSHEFPAQRFLIAAGWDQESLLPSLRISLYFNRILKPSPEVKDFIATARMFHHFTYQIFQSP